MEEDDEMPSTANSELRYITLELMRLAQKSGKSFSEIAGEFIKNTVLLQEMVACEAESKEKSKAKKGSNSGQK